MSGTGCEDDGDGHGHFHSPECTFAAKIEASSPSFLAAEEEAGSSSSNTRTMDAPLQFLVYFHVAMREELAYLLRLAINALECCGSSGISRDVISELHRRFEFFSRVYKYHSAAEDEVIFHAIDANVKNVAGTYSLEHRSIDNLFDNVFNYLNMLMEESNNVLLAFQDIVICISTLQSYVCQHMLKEEEQVFPLFLIQFSPEEQSSLLWQFICSIPVILLKELLPWIVSYLSPGNRQCFNNCIIEIVPREKLLQEVVISWIYGNDQIPYGDLTKNRQVAASGSANMKSLMRSYTEPVRGNWQGKKPCHFHLKEGFSIIDYLCVWHGAIEKDLKKSLEDLYRRKTSTSVSNINSTILLLKFLADVISFYSNALKKFFYPVLDELSKQHPYIEDRVESLLKLLHCHVDSHLPQCAFQEILCQELDSFIMDICNQFHLLETKVLPLIRKNYSNESQKQLLFMGLHFMPLGLLKCVCTWFAVHWTKSGSISVPQSTDVGDLLAYGPLDSLLHHWFYISYTSEKSAENFGKTLCKIFSSRSSFFSMHVAETCGCCSLNIESQGPKEQASDATPSSDKGKKVLSYASSGSIEARPFEESYSTGINLHVLYLGTMRMLQAFPNFHGVDNSTISNEPIPIDLLFLFHKGLTKDMDHLVHFSSQLAEDLGLVSEIRKHFNSLLCRYQFHSSGEDEVAFAALELKEKVKNISHSYTIDHKLEAKLFGEISHLLDEISKLHNSVSSLCSCCRDSEMIKISQLSKKLYRKCKSIHKITFDHVQREEMELWPLFRKFFSIREQERIIGKILGRGGAEILQDLIPWLLGHLTPKEQLTMMSLWRKVTKNTKFDEWLAEWWEGHDAVQPSEKMNTSPPKDTFKTMSCCVSNEVPKKQSDIICSKGNKFLDKNCLGTNMEMWVKCSLDNKAKVLKEDQSNTTCSELQNLLSKGSKTVDNQAAEIAVKMERPVKYCQPNQPSKHHDFLSKASHDELKSAVRKASLHSCNDSQKKSHQTHNQPISECIVQKQTPIETAVIVNGNEIPGQHPSYKDPLNKTLGCKHYKRNCKLLTACCNQLYTCLRCHDEAADHSADRREIVKMMCMKCLVIQPIRQTCSTASCKNLFMAKYYCKICKLFDDDRQIYHCPYCNLCRVGKGLGVEYFHCMNCNACMSRSLSVHVCREKSFEDNCPICHEDIFTSCNPVKALPCGHMMHSTCFQEYTYTHYICPICCKSLGDMQVYFNMLDALLSEEKTPDEYCSRMQAILCNDCEKKGTAPFHWLYHKCGYCGSYNTRLL